MIPNKTIKMKHAQFHCYHFSDKKVIAVELEVCQFTIAPTKLFKTKEPFVAHHFEQLIFEVSAIVH